MLRQRRRFALAAVLAPAALALTVNVSAASATTYCVASAPNCSGTPASTLEVALSQASDDTQGSDRIVLPAATFSNPDGFEYDGHIPLEIDGQGPTATLLTMSAPTTSSQSVFTTTSSDTTSPVTLSSLGIEIPAGPAGADSGVLSFSPTTVTNIAVTAIGGTAVQEGLALAGGGTVSRTTVSFSASVTSFNVALVFAGGSGDVEDSSLAGNFGIWSDGASSLVVHRSQAYGSTGDGAGIAISGGQAQIDDSVLGGYQDAPALGDEDASEVTARQLTIVGDSQSIGVAASGTQSSPVSLSLSDSIIAEPLYEPFEISKSGSGAVTITSNHDDYSTAGLPAGFVAGPGDLASYAAPAFADSDHGDYRLLASSPSALFSADPVAQQAGESTTDLDGLPRFNGAARDLGAYQHQAPTVTAAAGSSSLVAGVATTFTAVGSTTVPNDPLTYKWSFDDGQTATGADVSQAFATAGTHTGTVTVSDALGFTATAAVSLTVVTPALPPALSNALTLKCGVTKKNGVLTLRLGTADPGVVRVTTTFVETFKTTTRKGKHRKTRVHRRTVAYTRTTTAEIGSGDRLTLKLKPTKAALKHLRSVKHEKVTVTVRFTPTGGTGAIHKLTVRV